MHISFVYSLSVAAVYALVSRAITRRLQSSYATDMRFIINDFLQYITIVLFACYFLNVVSMQTVKRLDGMELRWYMFLL